MFLFFVLPLVINHITASGFIGITFSAVQFGVFGQILTVHRIQSYLVTMLLGITM